VHLLGAIEEDLAFGHAAGDLETLAGRNRALDESIFVVDSSIRLTDDELDPLTKQKFVKHVSDCSCCHEFLEQYRTTIALIREAEDIEPPKELVEKTLIFLESQRLQ